MFRESIYNAVGILIGFILCPLALLGLAVPILLLFPLANSFQIAAGVFFGSITLGIMLCNIYLGCRREFVDQSASIFPLFGTVPGAAAFALLGEIGWLKAFVIFVFLEIAIHVMVGVICSSLRRWSAH